MKLKIFVGWDSREDIAYQVCVTSLKRHASEPLEIVPLKQKDLREQELYFRKKDPLASTEFTYTRFLVPKLMDYKGWALFVDCDFLFTADIVDLFSLADDRYAVMCVKHDYRPTETVKMDGAVQTVYPRKNWSSMVLWNCSHPANRVVTPETVNNQTASFLHRFQWLSDDLIGEVSETWNWLEGWSQRPKDGPPKAIHFTRGGPWFENCQRVDYAQLWLEERDRFLEKKKQKLARAV